MSATSFVSDAAVLKAIAASSTPSRGAIERTVLEVVGFARIPPTDEAIEVALEMEDRILPRMPTFSGATSSNSFGGGDFRSVASGDFGVGLSDPGSFGLFKGAILAIQKRREVKTDKRAPLWHMCSVTAQCPSRMLFTTRASQQILVNCIVKGMKP
jgi:hypothetical protein